MNIKARFSGIIRFFCLILVILLAYPLAGQQAGSSPVITLVSPASSDSLNNTGVTMVSATIVSNSALLTYRIVHNGATVVDETGMKPEKKDDLTYVISSFVPLKKGMNTIHVEAKNSGGTAISEIRTVNSRLEPFITWLYPVPDNANIESGVINIKAEIRTGYTLQNLIINVNGTGSSNEMKVIKALDNSAYIYEKTIQLKPGKNSIYMSADNGKGVTRSVTRIINFGIAPVITLVSPSPADSTNNSGLVLVSAEIISNSPLQTFRIVHNGITAVNESGMKPEQKNNITWVIGSNVPLIKGTNTVFVEAKNSIGIAISEKRLINSHLEPFITWILPASDNSFARSGVLNIKAEIKTIHPLQNVWLNLNGSFLANERTGITPLNNDTFIFEKGIQLKPGKNSIFISAGNTKGSNKSATRTINFGSAPVITLISPSSADSLNTSGVSLVRAEIISYTALQTFRIIHNGITVVSETGMKPEQKDSITYVIGSNVPLIKGQNTVYVEAKNILGTSSSEKRTIDSRSEPFITWLLPASETSTTESGTVRIKAEIRTFLDLQSIRLNLNGTELTSEQGEITRLNDDTYLFERTLQNILTTRNTVFITASNIRGKTNSETRSINYSSGSKPVITISSTDSLNNSGIILFSAEIVSRTKLQAVRIIHNSNVLAAESVKTPEQKDSVTYILKSLVPLKAGPNILYVEAKNTFGTASSEKRNIICQPEPIINWISPSAFSSSGGSGTFTIKAEIITSFDLLNTSINLNGNVLADQKDGITRVNNEKYVFEKAVPLKEGENNIILIAGNARGTGYSPRRNITYVPGIISEIKWITPLNENSDTRRSEFAVSASINTKSEIRNTSLYLNGTEILPGERSKTTRKSNQEYLYENTLALKPGVNTIEFSAITDQGTISAEKRTINYTVPVLPVLAWKNPLSGQSEVNQASLDIRMNIRSTEELDNIAVYLNGKVLDNVSLLNSVKKENEDFVLGSTVVLKPGENSIYVAARNIAGTATSETINIKYLVPSLPAIASINPEPPAAPVVTWVSPSRSSTPVSLTSAEIRATVKSSEKLQSLMVYVNGVGSEEINQVIPTGLQDEYVIKKTVNLQPGDNTIYLSVTNSIGTIRSDDRLLTNPPASKPFITWAIPSDASISVNSDMIIVEACIKSSTELKKAQIYINGVEWASETMFQAPQSGDCNYRFTKSVLLKEGDNTVIINATNLAGSEISDRRLIRFQKGITEQRLALVMGNSEYGSTLSLKNPVNDANLIEGTLKTLGFEVIKLLNAKKVEMEQAIREFSEKLPDYNVALFYYAGHGIQVGGENYLIPTDAVLDKESDCQWEAVQVNTIVRQFEQVPENINIIILDACRDNPFKSWTRGAPQGFKMLNTVSGTFVSFATAEGTTAGDGEGINGPFTEELVKQMVMPQSIFNVFVNTRKQVMLRTNNRQRPQESNMLTGDFYFKK